MYWCYWRVNRHCGVYLKEVCGCIPVDSVGLKKESIGQNDKLECVEKFCYLGDMIWSGGGSEEASKTRVRCAWAKYRELSPI